MILASCGGDWVAFCSLSGDFVHVAGMRMAQWWAACALFSVLGWFRAHFGDPRASRTAVSLDRGIKIMTFTDSLYNVVICRCWRQFGVHFGDIWGFVSSCREALGPGWPACCCLLAVAGQLGWLAGGQDFGMPES